MTLFEHYLEQRHRLEVVETQLYRLRQAFEPLRQVVQQHERRMFSKWDEANKGYLKGPDGKPMVGLEGAISMVQQLRAWWFANEYRPEGHPQYRDGVSVYNGRLLAKIPGPFPDGCLVTPPREPKQQGPDNTAFNMPL